MQSIGNDFESLLQTLLKFFRYEQFKPHQQEMCQSVLGGSDVFCSMATGSGKSMAFQLPAICLRDRHGILATTVVICPLLSLIEDQVAALRARGVNAIAIGGNSSMEVERLAMEGEYVIVLSCLVIGLIDVDV